MHVGQLGNIINSFDHPQLNGQIERVHIIIEVMLWAYVANRRGE